MSPPSKPEDLAMRTMISTALIGAVLSFTVSSAFAQTVPAPAGPNSCKPGEMYDPTLKTCTETKK